MAHFFFLYNEPIDLVEQFGQKIMESVCVACQAKNLEFFGKRLDYEYFKCPQCGTVQLYPQPTESELLLAYEKEYASANHYQGDPIDLTQSATPYYRSLIETVQVYGVSGEILDYGAGWGSMCQMFLDKGYQCAGLEISESMVEYCQKNHIPVEKGDISVAVSSGKRYSALVLCTVFEHLINHDLWMQDAARVLEDGGYLFTLQPTANFSNFMGNLLRLGDKKKELPQLHQVFAPPWHTAFFSGAGMEALAERHDFELVEIRIAPQGRRKGMLGVVQVMLENINKAGSVLLGTDWPLIVAHIFVLRKKIRNNH